MEKHQRGQEANVWFVHSGLQYIHAQSIEESIIKCYNSFFSILWQFPALKWFLSTFLYTPLVAGCRIDMSEPLKMHDQPRTVSRIVQPPFRCVRSKQLQSLLNQNSTSVCDLQVSHTVMASCYWCLFINQHSARLQLQITFLSQHLGMLGFKSSPHSSRCQRKSHRYS